MNNESPQKDQPPVPGTVYSGIPLNPPSSPNSAIPINIANPNPAASPAPAQSNGVGQTVPGGLPSVSPGYIAPGLQATPYMPLNDQTAPVAPFGAPLNAPLNGPPVPSAPYGAPVNAPLPGTPLAYPQQAAGQTPYAQQLPPVAPNPYPQRLPQGYQVPNSPYNNAPNTGYGTPQTESDRMSNGMQKNSAYKASSSKQMSDGAVLGMGLLVGIILTLVCGVGFGFASAAMGFRIPYLSLAIGYIMGYAVLKGSGGGGSVPGIIAGTGSLLACLLGFGIMYLKGIEVNAFSFLIVAFATYRGYQIASNG